MASLTDSAGLLFTIKGDSSSAVKEIEQAKTSLKSLESTASSSSASIGQSFIGAGSAIAGVGVAITAVATGAALAFFRLAQSSADFGSAIFDATEKTGLSAETISSLKVAADQSGSSLEAVTSGISKFARTIGEAGDGSDKAQSKLTKLGVTSTDLDTALGQALSTISKYPPGVEQMTAAQAAFGKSGSDLLPFIKSFDGDLPALIAKCKELGLTMSDANAKASDELGDSIDTLHAQFSGLFRTLGTAFLPLFQQIVNAVSSAMPTIRSAIESIGPVAQVVIAGIVGIAAVIGPLLIAAGGIIVAVGAIVSGVAALGGVAAIASGIGIALLAVIGLFIQLAPVIAIVALQIGALYLAWQNDFGGIRTFTIQAFEAIKSTIQTAMAFINGVTQSVGGAIVGWWRDNYPLIQATVTNVSNSIKTTIQGFLDAVRGFWERHGASITAYVQGVWDLIKTIVGNAVTQIGNVVRLGMELINGNWSGAWQAFLDIVSTGAKNATQVISGMASNIGKYLSAMIPVAIEVLSQFASTLISWVTKAVIGVVYILNTLPEQIIKLVPIFVKAGMGIGAAIWRGIQQGLAGATGASTGLGGVAFGASGSANLGGGFTPALSIPGAGGGGGKGAGGSKDTSAEDLAKRDAAARLAGERNNLQQTEKEIDTILDALIAKIKEFGLSDNVIEFVAKEFDRLTTNINNNLDALEKLENQKRATNTAAENSLLTQEQILRRDAEADRLAKARADFEKGVAGVKKEADDKGLERLDQEIKKTKELLEAEKERVKNLEFLKLAENPDPINLKPDAPKASNNENYLQTVLGTSVLDTGKIDDAGNHIQSLTGAFSALGQIGKQAVQGLANGVGSLVQNLVLLGVAGSGGMKKVVASVLAGVAAQAAVLAVMELAYGIAALTPWGAAVYGPAPLHFKAAALFGSIALVSGLAGRAVAGDSFKQGTAGGGAGANGGGANGDGPDNGNRPGLVFTEFFAGFQQKANDRLDAISARFDHALDRTNTVLGGVVDAVDGFTGKFGAVTPGHVVMAGAGDAAANIFDAMGDHMESDLQAATTFRRKQGLYS